MKIKNMIKNNIKLIVGIIIGAILFGGMGVVIATNIASSSVNYTTNKNANVENVEDALDDLYDQIIGHPILCFNGTCGKVSFRYWNNNFAGRTGVNLFDSTHMPANNYATRALLAQNYSDFSVRPDYIKSILIDGNVVGHETCFWEANNQKEFCLRSGYWAGTIDINDSTVGENTMIKLQRDMQNELGLESTDISCDYFAEYVCCDVGDFRCSAASTGHVSCRSNVNYNYCRVNYDGSAFCS